MAIEILIACLLLVALTFLSLVDVAFGELSDVGLRRLIGDAEEEPRGGGVSTFLGEILENRSRFRHTLTVSILILVVAISFLVFHAALVTLYQSSSFENLSPSVAHASAFLVALGATALARQVIPRVVAARRPEATLRRLLPVLRPLYRPLSLVAFAWFGKTDRQRRAEQQQVEGGADEDEDDGDDLQALIDVGEEEG
ncbi:MAG: CNNM domain-containing protein, partial [Acidobacteria bacterium]|nr:CNNM domain-containing protein [Acidobacteriota bacterium]